MEAPPFNKYNSTLRDLSTVQKINASLGIQLANAWINRNNTHGEYLIFYYTYSMIFMTYLNLFFFFIIIMITEKRVKI